MEEKSQVTIGLATKPSVRPSQPTDSKENLFESKIFIYSFILFLFIFKIFANYLIFHKLLSIFKEKEITSKEWEDFINDNDISFKKIILTCKFVFSNKFCVIITLK